MDRSSYASVHEWTGPCQVYTHIYSFYSVMGAGASVSYNFPLAALFPAQTCCVALLGRTYPEEILSRVLYATQFTRHVDRQGYVRLKNWRLFGEHGLAGSDVSIWIYGGMLKIEYQATDLALYSVRLSSDKKQIEEVWRYWKAQVAY